MNTIKDILEGNEMLVLSIKDLNMLKKFVVVKQNSIIKKDMLKRFIYYSACVKKILKDLDKIFIKKYKFFNIWVVLSYGLILVFFKYPHISDMCIISSVA